MNIPPVILILLTEALMGGFCVSLNVTVTPGPVLTVSEGQNVTLSCEVSQSKRPTHVLVARWLFSRHAGHEQLIVRLNIRRAEHYGNYTRRFTQPKLRVYEGLGSESYDLLILNISAEDQGHYICKVQEIRKHRNRWRAAANGTAATQLRAQPMPPSLRANSCAPLWLVLGYVDLPPVSRSREGVWHLFEDVYLCAVLICSLGLLCTLLFMVTITCQYLHRRRRLKASYYLVKSPQNSSGETVTSVLSPSPATSRKEKKHKHALRECPEAPPEIPAKAPAPRKPRRHKLLKVQQKKVPLITEESLTYAELELVKPRPDSKATCTDTVYAQIVFEEKV